MNCVPSNFWARLAAISIALLVLVETPVSSAELQARTNYLLLDERVIDRTENVQLRVGKITKHPANPLFKEDKPWEVRFDNVYANVLYDEELKLYRCWYSPFIFDELTMGTPAQKRADVKYRATPTREMGVCYAVSQDGIRWEKPVLGVVEFNGSTSNNLVLRSSHGAGVMKDLQERDPTRRYKLFGGQQIPGLQRRFQVAFSADGIHWTTPVVCPEVGVEGDTHNNAIWATDLNKYVGITRLFSGQRLVMRTESCDFTHWTKAAEILRGNLEQQTYAMPVFRYADVYLGLVMILNTRTDRVHCELSWSPDTVQWHRVDPGHALIPNSDTPRDYDWGCVYAGATPSIRDDEIRIYYGASNDAHGTWRDGFLALATLRPDRFAGLEAEDQAGSILTKPLKLEGSQLQVNVDARQGQLVVEVLDADGQPFPGFSLAEASRHERVDELRFQPRWQHHSDLSALRGKIARLKFHLHRAKLYSFRIQ